MIIAALRLHTAFCLAALFTISWDRLANLAVGTYNVKLPVLLFAGAWVVSWFGVGPVPAVVRQVAVARAVILLAVAYGIGVALTVSVPTAAVQAVTVVLGALLPFLAVWRTLRLGDAPAPLLTAFISGAVVAAVFGFYQLAAFYTGLPNPLPYTGLGGGAGRIAAFSYEPAYFAYFLILAVAAWFARESLTGRAHRRWVPGLLLTALVLCNSRAVFLMLPLLAVLLFARRGIRMPRGLPVLGVLAGYLALIAWVASGSLRAFLAARVGSIADPTEVTSNAPRLDLYGSVLRLARDHWLTGVGPGNLLDMGPWYGLPIEMFPDPSPNNVIANNVWLQALVDGGLVLLAAHVVLVAVVVWRLYRPGGPVRALAAGWLSVVIVGGMLTSWFYDIKLWVVLAMAVGIAAQAAQKTGRVPTVWVRQTGDVSPPLKN